MAFLLAIAAALLLGSSVGEMRLTGTVVADRNIVRLEAPRDAIVRQLRISEGQIVREGQVLLVLGMVEEAVGGPTARQLLAGLLVRAPVGGTLSSLDVAQGQALAARAPMASIVPAGSHWEVDLRGPEATVGRLAPGQPVWLRFEALPDRRHGQFRGVIRSISRSSASEDGGEWRVRVRLEDRRLPELRPDMKVTASVGRTILGTQYAMSCGIACAYPEPWPVSRKSSVRALPIM